MYREISGDSAPLPECAGAAAFFDRDCVPPDCTQPEARRAADANDVAADSPAVRDRRESEDDGRDSSPAGVNGERQTAEGRLKWFDRARGYGFVALDEIDEDALLPASCLKQAGREDIVRGARITCQVARRPKGFQVVCLLGIDEGGGLAQASALQARPDGAFQRAVVKWFDCRRGYGFASTGADGLDVFVHAETLQRCEVGQLQDGDEIMVRCCSGPRGLSAAEVRPMQAQEMQEEAPGAQASGAEGLLA